MNKQIEWGWKQYFRPTPKNVKQWLIFFKGIIGSTAVGALTQEKPYWAVGLLIGGAVVDEIVKFIGQDVEVQAVEEAEAAIKDKVHEVAEEIINNEVQ